MDNITRYADSPQKKPLYKEWWIYPVVILVGAFFVVGIPLIINEAYKVDSGYLTLWDASDVLSFYAVILSGIITIGALIATIRHSKNDTEKQMKFLRSQVKTPFFIIETVFHTLPESQLDITNDRKWCHKYSINTDGTILSRNKYKIAISLKNIGDGIALSARHRIDTIADTEMFDQQFVLANESFTLLLDLQKHLFNAWIPHYTSCRSSQSWVPLDKNILLFYQNTLGVIFQQQIKLSLQYDPNTNIIMLIVNETTPQILLN